DRAIIEPRVELGLLLRAAGELDQLPGETAARRALEHAPRAGRAHRAVPDELDRHALLLELGRARVPDRHHVDLAVADELLRLVPFAPPHLDVRLDLVELLERAVEVERIEVFTRHPVGQKREDQRARRIADAQAAGAGEFLYVPEVGPALRPAI